jgi:hypothetical protein
MQCSCEPTAKACGWSHLRNARNSDAGALAHILVQQQQLAKQQVLRYALVLHCLHAEWHVKPHAIHSLQQLLQHKLHCSKFCYKKQAFATMCASAYHLLYCCHRCPTMDPLHCCSAAARWPPTTVLHSLHAAAP